MSKNFYLSLIPVGESKWKTILKNIAMSTILYDDAYKCWRYFDELQAKESLEDEPVFFPNTAINLKGNVKFRIAISLSILYPYNDKNSCLITTPWKDDLMSYKEASWLSVNEIINQHSDYILIIKNQYSELQQNDKWVDSFIDRIINLCKKANKKYKVITDEKSIKYKDVYEYFFNN